MLFLRISQVISKKAIVLLSPYFPKRLVCIGKPEYWLDDVVTAMTVLAMAFWCGRFFLPAPKCRFPIYQGGYPVEAQ